MMEMEPREFTYYQEKKQVLKRTIFIILEEIIDKIKNLPKKFGNDKRQLETIIDKINNLVCKTGNYKNRMKIQ